MKDKILSLAVKGKITGEDIERLYDEYGIGVIKSLGEMLKDGTIKESYIPMPGASYVMDYIIQIWRKND